MKFLVHAKFLTSYCEYDARVLTALNKKKMYMRRKSNWLVDNWQYGFSRSIYLIYALVLHVCVFVCWVCAECVCASDLIYIYFALYGHLIIIGKMWRGHTQVTLFACYLFAAARETKKKEKKYAFTTVQPPHSANNRKKAKIANFHCSIESNIWLIVCTFNVKFISKFYFECIRNTQCAPIYLFYCMHALHTYTIYWQYIESDGKWSVDRFRSELKMVCGMRRTTTTTTTRISNKRAFRARAK